MSDPLAKRHADYVQIVPPRTPARSGGPSLHIFAEEELRAALEAEPDGYARISKEQAEALLPVIDEYVVRYGPLVEEDELLVAELHELLDGWQ